MLRVLVVEDSPTERELLVEILRADPEIEVVGQAKDGREALQLAIDLRPNLIAMDVHMPRMDGLEATRAIMVEAPTPILLVSSSAVGREVELSFEALQAGALAMIEKPGHPGSPHFERRRSQLLSLAKALSQVRVVRRWAAPGGRVEPPPRFGHHRHAPRVRLVAIAASTGGPAALRELLRALPADLPVPVVVVQHIARGFVGGFVDWLRQQCALRIAVAEDLEPLVPGSVFIAPDDRQLGVAAEGWIRVTHDPPVEGFRPSATHLFGTAAAAYGPGVVAVMLTGMGSDGVDGLRAVKAAGGLVIAQDEATSVVYGMPREASRAGVVDVELPLSEIAAHLTLLLAGKRHGHYDSHR
jgi:two-component system chemotaxis response regulator CheB